MKTESRESIVLENEGQKIFGVLHSPENVKKPPCVVICHGLGGNKVGHYRVYVELAEQLVQHGIAVFRFDFRGCGDSEGAFADMSLKGEVSDAVKVLQFIQQNPRFDHTRVGLFGRSMGGAVAVLSTEIFDHVKSMVLWAPIYSGDQWKNKWSHVQNGLASEHESQEWRRINGQVASLNFYAEMFAMEMKPAIKALTDIPLLLIHGINDSLVTIEHSESYDVLRKNAMAPTEFIRLEHADHDFTHSEERAFAVGRTVQWFKETL